MEQVRPSPRYVAEQFGVLAVDGGALGVPIWQETTRRLSKLGEIRAASNPSRTVAFAISAEGRRPKRNIHGGQSATHAPRSRF